MAVYFWTVWESADLYQTMARYGPCIFRNWNDERRTPSNNLRWKMAEWQFSILMIESLLQRASSKGRLCRLGLSFKYSSSRFSSVPVIKNILKISYYLKPDLSMILILGYHAYWTHSAFYSLLVLKLSTTMDLKLSFLFK